jgi:hypothetical protein
VFRLASEARGEETAGGRSAGPWAGAQSAGLFDIRRMGLRGVCYTAIMRPGRTKTTSFSLDDATLKTLKALAARRHKGNVSALLAELATREARLAAAEAYFEKYGVPPLSDEAVERIEAEWRGESPKKARRRIA